MGIALALGAMLAFATNIMVTRYAVQRLPVEAGFLVVLAANTGFAAIGFVVELAVRTTPFAWQWKEAGLFALSGVIGTFLGRRMLFDAVQLLGPARASVFHSSAPAFAMLGAWVFAGEALGLLELALVAIVWSGLWLCHPPMGTQIGATTMSAKLRRQGMLAGIGAVAGFGFGNVVRGIGMRSWEEAILASLIASIAAITLQAAVTRDWRKIATQWRDAKPGAYPLYMICGFATTLGAILISLAMTHIEIGLAVLIVHTTPIVIFPVSVFILKHREELTMRTVGGALMVLGGIAAIALR